MGLTTNDQLLIESRITNDGKNIVVAYLFWFFLGLFSAHRFYLGRPGTAILQIVLYFVAVGFVWLFVDVFLIPSMVRKKNDELRIRLTTQMLAQQPLTV